MKSSVTISLVPEARGGPFVFWDDLAAAMEKAALLGFDGVEIFPASADDLDVAEVMRLLQQHKLELAAIGTGAGWAKHKLRLTDPDPEIRKRARQFAAKLVDLAGGLGAPAIIGSMQGRWGDGVTRDQAIGWLREAFDELAVRASSHNIILLYEPLNRYETNVISRIADALDFLASLRAKNVKLLCDLFHMNIEESDPPAALRGAGSHVGHIHFVDSNRLAVGLGHTNIPPIIQALREIGYSGFLSAEALPLPDSETAARQSIAAFRRWVGSGSAN
jgi:sugar phosphate isomerase/epimerase